MAFCGRGFKMKLRRKSFARLLLFLVAIALCVCLLTALVACDDKDNDSGAPSSGDVEGSDDETEQGGDVPSSGDTPSDEDKDNEDEKPKLKTFDEVVFEDESVVYDGEAHVIEPKKTPFGTKVSYLEKNFVDAGEYQVVATLKLAGYETATLTATLTILPAQAEVRFEDRTFTWDGAEHSIYIDSSLPEGAYVTYEGNGKTEVGIYTVTAHVELGKNYVPVEDLTARLIIEECTYVVSFVHWDGEVETRTVYRGRALSKDDFPLNKQKEGYYQMIWDPDQIKLLEDVRSDVTVREIEGEAKIYTVILNPNGGFVDPAGFQHNYLPLDDAKVMMTYTIDDDIKLIDAYKPDDVFVGWYDEEGRLVTRLPDEAGLRDMVLTARWESEFHAGEKTCIRGLPRGDFCILRGNDTEGRRSKE